MNQNCYVIGLDVGGTNTDSVLINVHSNSILKTNKGFTSIDITSGIQNSISNLLVKAPQIQKEDIKAIIIGTTHFINAILQKGDTKTNEKLSKVSVIRFSGPQSYDFPPFCNINNDELKERMQGPSYILDGGYYFNGKKQYTKFNQKQVEECIQKIIEAKIHNIVISSTYGIVNLQQEEEASKLIQAECSKQNYEISITLSAELCKKEGLIERENAAIVNESLKKLAYLTFQSYQKALSDIGLENANLFISHNDGSIMKYEVAIKNPIFTFSASIINSLKGGCEIYKEKDAIVVDIGGTSTDISVMSKGLPITTGKYTEINGITLNFRMPLVHSIALGGGSIVKVTRNTINNEVEVQIMKESVAFRLKQDAISFDGGSILCNTDFAIYNNEKLEKSIGGKRQLFEQYFLQSGFQKEEIEKICIIHQKILVNKLCSEIETLISDSSQKIKVLLVGGGAILVDVKLLEETTNNVCQVAQNELFSEIANAYGASLADITETIEQDIVISDKIDNEQEQVNQIEQNLIQKALDKGSQNPVETVEIIINKLSYLEQMNTKKVYMKVKGRFNWLNMKHNTSIKQQLLSAPIMIESSNEYAKFDELSILFKLSNSPKYDPNNTPKHLKPCLTLHNSVDIDILAWGCSILGSGGGGSVEKTSLLLKSIMKQQQYRAFSIFDPESMDEHNDLVCGVAHFGAPSVFFEYNFTINELYGSFVSLNKMFNGKLNGIICLELGGCNGLSPLIVSMACGLPLFDINFMCRAFPEYKMTLPCINGNIGLPISFGDAKHNRFIIESLYSEENDRSSQSECQQLEDLLRDWVVNYLGLMGNIACYGGSNKEFVLNNGFLNGYQLAYKIGQIFYNGIQIQQRSVDDVIQNDLKQVDECVMLLIKGKIISVKRDTKKGYDFGELIVKQSPEEQNFAKERRVLITYKNEYLLAYELQLNESNQWVKALPTVITPDIITIVDDFKGKVIHSEDACYGLRVNVFAMRTDEKFKSEKALKFVGPEGMGLGCDFAYKPYY